MFEKFLKRSTWTDMLLSLIFIVFGLLLFAYPETIGSMIAIIFGGIFVVMGILRLIDYFATDKKDNYLLAVAISAILAGIVIMFCADIILSIFRILIAIWIIYSGIMDLQTTIIWKDYKSKAWYVTLVLSILMIIAGIATLVNQGIILSTIGIIILVYGIIDIIENIIFIKKIDNYVE